MRVRYLSKPYRYLKHISQLWQTDVENIKSSWWYGKLSAGEKRFLTYRLDLIEHIVNSSLTTKDVRVYKLGNEAIAFTTEIKSGWFLCGVCVRPLALKDISGKSSGFGERLIRFILKDARNHGANMLSLHPGMTALKKYYRKLGFCDDGIMRGIGTVMSKELVKDRVNDK